MEVTSLADAVLPLIRAGGRDLWRYYAANEQGRRMHEGVDVLRVALDNPAELLYLGVTTPTAKEVYTTTHKALASAIRVIARADDSSGIIGDACRDLIDLHPRAAALAEVPPLKLADWVFKFHFDDDVDYFELDPVAYAPALGEKGLARLRERVETLRGEVSGAPRDRGYSHDESTLRWFDKRFAVLDRDVEAIIRTHLWLGGRELGHEHVAEALEEIGGFALATEWAEKAVLASREYHGEKAAPRWLRLTEEHSPERLPEVARTVFERWPTASNAARWVSLAGGGSEDEAQRILEARPRELVLFELNVLGRVQLAWDTAHRLQITDQGLWSRLAEAYIDIDPMAGIEVQLQVVFADLVRANTRAYRPAANDLVKMRKAAQAAPPEVLAMVDAGIADLRAKYRRRPSLMAELDLAKLP
ncbi:hypothetical protein JT358_13360 [Micrococcales bacterium 31B]|nr:hypothetical protein [Micrococcales bacterium 31B]